MKQSEAYKSLLAAYEQAMASADDPMLKYPWHEKVYYGAWVAQFYYFLCHATRLLCASGARLKMDEDIWHLRMVDHCQQEKTHERMALADLKGLGYSLNDFPELPITAQLYQSQYYLIEHEHPSALFGCVLFLEGISLHSGQHSFKEVKKNYGPESYEFLRTHTNEDVEHIEQAFAVIRQLPDDHLRIAQWSLEQCAFIYLKMMEEMTKQAQQKLELTKAA